MARSHRLSLALAAALLVAACGETNVEGPVPVPPGPDASETPDATALEPDATSLAPDAGFPDAASPDAQASDSGTPDASPNPPDASAPDAGAPDGSGPILVLPKVIDLPYVVAGQGGSQLDVDVRNDGDGPLVGLSFSITGSAAIHATASFTSVPAHSSAALRVSFDGAAQETIVEAVLHAATADQSQQAPVFAVAGSPALGASAWQAVVGAGGVACGEGATVSMPTAPFPDPSATYTDSSVRVFVPEGYRDRGGHDLVLHFHGFSTTVAATIAAHRYQEHLYESGVNAVLVVPQGPVNAASGNFGKLMRPDGTLALLDEVLVLLYREGRISHPRLGEVAITSHSGGYQAAVAANLGSTLLPVTQIDLFDSVYGYASTFETFAVGGGRLRSDYTETGGTLANNQAMATWLSTRVSTSTAATTRALRDSTAVVYESPTTHSNSTRWDGAFGEWLRWGMPHHRRGARAMLRSVVPQGGQAVVRWLSPRDEDLAGWSVETSTDGGGTWTLVAVAAPTDEQVTIPLASGMRVRLRAQVPGIAEPESQTTNAYRVDPGTRVLVVDRFDRVLGGSWGGLSHDFSATVGEAVAAGVATVHHRALTEDGFDLSAYDAVIWLTGDSSSDDHTFDPGERTLVQSWIGSGGHLLASGSEIGYDLAGISAAPTFLEGTLGAHYVSDDSGSYSVVGTGPLASVTPFTYSGTSAPYQEDYPDIFSAVAGGQVVLNYATATGAAAGVSGKSAVVGFPLELVDDSAARRRVVTALLGYAGY